MLPTAVKLLDHEPGNAQAFMDGVNNGQVKRLQTSKKIELQNYLELHGFIDVRPVLGSDQIMSHIVKAVTTGLASGTVSLPGLRHLVAQIEQAIQ